MNDGGAVMWNKMAAVKLDSKAFGASRGKAEMSEAVSSST
jgi:hypothetical protein